MRIPLKRYQNPFISNEIINLINLLEYVNEYIMSCPGQTLPKTREWLRKALGVGTHQAKEIVDYWKSGERPPAEIRTTSGWTKEVDPAFLGSVREHIQEQNLAGKHVSLRTIANHLATLSTPPTHIQVYSWSSVSFHRHSILFWKASPSPKVPEVFLDESYCHIGHHKKMTWTTKGGVVLDHGRGPMMVIFGAFIVYNNGDKVQAEIVKKSLHIWPVNGLSHLSAPLTTKDKNGERIAEEEEEVVVEAEVAHVAQKRKRGRPAKNSQRADVQEVVKVQKRKRGRPAKDAQGWQVYPEAVREASLPPDTRDYHGNFNAEVFEKLFEQLCKDLKNTYKVGCAIHMDGARYHIRRENPKPGKTTRKPEILAWLTENNINLPPPKRQTHTVKEIMDHLDTIDWPVVRACSRIAKEYGHKIIITPPYHCEVQPIERVWAYAKNPIALDPVVDESPLQLRDRLYKEFAKITQKHLISAWREALRACKAHLLGQTVENVEIDDEDNTDDEEVPDDMDIYDDV